MKNDRVLRDGFGDIVTFHNSDTAFIPVNAGGLKIKYAMVDRSDAATVQSFLWGMSSGYAIRGFKKNGKTNGVPMHRMILGLQPADGKVVDHANHDPLDNRRRNIRITDPFGNMQNVIAGYGESGIRGAYKHTDRVAKGKVKWKSLVKHKGKAHYGGTFNTAEEAGAASAALRKKLGFLGS